jgi:hypothetical protein
MLAKELNECVWLDGREISMTILKLMTNYLAATYCAAHSNALAFSFSVT